MLAVLHCGEGNRHMHLPVGADVHEVHVVTLAEVQICLFSNVFGGTGASALLNAAAGGFNPVGFDVADGGHGAARHICQAHGSPAATVAEANHTNPDVGDRIGGEPEHVLLSCGTGGNLGLDRKILTAGDKQRRSGH